MKKSFTLIELVFVIVVVAILAASINFSIPNTAMRQASEQILGHIRYTQHLALKQDKYQYRPLDAGAIEGNRSKYWFKQWPHLRITKLANDDIFYFIYSDQPQSGTTTNYNLKITSAQHNELYSDPLTYKYLMGAGYSSDTQYPDDENISTKMNLTQGYGITKISVSNTTYSTSSMGTQGDRVSLLFDNFGRPYFRESATASGGDEDDINPYSFDDRRKLQEILNVTFTRGTDGNFSICIYPETGYSEICAFNEL